MMVMVMLVVVTAYKTTRVLEREREREKEERLYVREMCLHEKDLVPLVNECKDESIILCNKYVHVNLHESTYIVKKNDIIGNRTNILQY